MTQKQSFIKGALILTAAGFGVRFIGAGFRILLAAIIGDEGIGLYQMAYPVYSTLLAISTAGIPIAISKLVSQYITKEDYRGAYRVFITALNILSISGLIISALMLVGARFIAENIARDPRAFYPIVAIAPAVFFVTIMSAFRGFFQGQQRMMPTAISQLFEQLFRVGAALALVILLIPKRLEWAAGGAAFGAAAGAVASLLVLMYIYSRDRREFIYRMDHQKNYESKGTMTTVYDILALSIPITLSHLVMPIKNLIDMSIVPMRLEHIGFDETRRMSLYGQLTGMAAPLIHIPQIISVALAVSLVPAISQALALKDNVLIRARTSLALRLSILLGFPSAIGLFILAEPITILLYRNSEAGRPLAVMAFAIIFISLFQTSSAVLQGLGKTQVPLINLTIGAVIKVALNWVLIGIPVLNILGAALASVISFAVASALNLKKLKSEIGLKLDILRTFIKPAFAVTFMGLAVYLTYAYTLPFLISQILETLSLNRTEAFSIFRAIIADPQHEFHSEIFRANALVTFISITVGMVSYGFALFAIGALDKKDLLMIPRLGPKILAIAQKLRFIR